MKITGCCDKQKSAFSRLTEVETSGQMNQLVRHKAKISETWLNQDEKEVKI